MSRTKKKYPNGYADKVAYWESRYVALMEKGEAGEKTLRAYESMCHFREKQEQWLKSQPKPEPDVLKFWCESSFDHEDTDKQFPEWLVIAVDMGEDGTKTIGEMQMDEKETVEALLEILNQEKFAS